MPDRPAQGSFARTNPFDRETVEDQFSPISAVYNVGYSQEVYESTQPIRDHFFDNLLIDLDSTSTVEELQEAIMRCKHLFLATPVELESKRTRLLNRLFVLRRMLHNLKEAGLLDEAQHVSRKSRIASATSSPTGHFSTLFFPFRHTRSSSVHSLPLLSGQTDRTSPRSDVSHRGGHDFHSVFPLRFLGVLCEYCMRPIRDLSRRIVHCSVCHIVCHMQHCHRSLTRRCPRVMESAAQSTVICPSLVSRMPIPAQHSSLGSSENVCALSQTEGSSENVGVYRDDLRSFATNPMKTFDFRHLQVTNLSYLGASLSAQHWACFECRRPIKCIPSSYTVVAEHSMMDTLIQRTSEVLESGVASLTKKATDFEQHQHASPNWTPQLNTQIPFLSDQVNRLLTPDPIIVTSHQHNRMEFHWACSSGSEDFGPVQTWEDIRVLEAINRFRAGSAQPFPVKLHFRKPAGNGVPEVVPQVCASGGFDQARLCYYTGHFYCSRCHWSDSYIIPACVFILGDYRPKPVCRSAFLWLTYSWSRHLFRVPDAWYRYEPAARKVCALRLRVFRLKLYLDCCEKLRSLQSSFGFSDTYWFLEQPYTFTMELVSSVLDSTLATKLTNFLAKAAEHIDLCQICLSSVSERCCVCDRGPIRVYNPEATFCRTCHRVCHRSCIPISSTNAYSPESPQDETPSSHADWLEVLSPAVRTFCPECARTRGR
ncbi:unnamed protein product [Dicrocoelium dendriticum]|nr:unnamed protein product [Dicrocoelium dendriticum]